MNTELKPKRACPHVPHIPDAGQTRCVLCGAQVSNDPKTGLWVTKSEAAPPDYAQRRAYIDECVPTNALVRLLGWHPPQEPGRWLLLARDADTAIIFTGIYEELKIVAEVIDTVSPFPDHVVVADLDERKLYLPVRKTVAFYQRGRAVESRMEIS